MLNVICVLLVGLAVGYLLFRLKVPGGMMVGAIVGVTAFNLLIGPFTLPYGVKLAAQCMAGAFIGCSVSREDIKKLPLVWKPTVIVLSSLLLLNVLLGFLITRISPLDSLTALLCAVPGGMSDIPMIATDMGADTTKVAVLQFVRMSAGIGLFPSLIALMAGHDVASLPAETKSAPAPRGEEWVTFFLTIAVAFGFGMLGRALHIPAGPLVFSMLGVIGLKLFIGRAHMPMWAKRIAQVLAGAYIGCGIAPGDLEELKYLLLPAVILLIGYFANALLTGRLLHKLLGIPLREAMLMATPAGASDMALISSDLGIRDPMLIELQILRLVVVVAVFPQLIQLIATWF